MYLSIRKSQTVIRVIAVVVLMLAVFRAGAEELKGTGVSYGSADLNGIKQSLKNVFDAAQNRGTESGVTGEQGSYYVNETTGAFEYDYPIYIPKLTQGPGLALGIHYNSQGSNGFMGLGAELTGLPSIKRDSRYDINYDNTDHFTLGGQKLIEDETKGYYRCEVEDYSYTYGGKYETETGWKVYLQDGTEMTFGGSSDSRLTTQAKSGAVYEWKLSEIKDPKGNNVVISYVPDSNERIPNTVHCHDIGSKSSIEIRFGYREQPRTDGYVKQMSKGWYKSRVLESITVTAFNDDHECTTTVRKYKFIYSYAGSGSNLVLKNIEEYGSCEYETSADLLNRVSFNWEIKALRSQRSSIPVMEGYVDGVWYKLDFNGDGKDDLYCMTEDALYVATGNGTGDYGTVSKWAELPRNVKKDGGTETYTYEFKIADCNGDNKLDLFIYEDYFKVNKPSSSQGNAHETYKKSYYYRPNTGSSISSETVKSEGEIYNRAEPLPLGEAYLIGSKYYSDETKTELEIDIDGDGLSDKLRQSEGTLYVKLNLGKGVYADEREYGSGISGSLYGPQGGFADINRDGKLDRYQVENGTLKVFYNNGAKLTTKIDLGIPCGSNITFDDINGDGSLDLLDINGSTVSKTTLYHTAASINKVSFTAGNSVNVVYKYKKEVTDRNGKLQEEGNIKRDKENPPVVSKIYEEDGTGHKLNDTSYKYGESFVYEKDRKDRTALGFEYVQKEIKTKDGNYIKVRNEYGAGSTEKEKRVLAGHPEKVTTYDEDYNKYSTVEYEYYIRKTLKDSYFVAVSAENTTLRNGKTGSGRKYYRKRYEYDTYGYVTLFNDYGEVDSSLHDIGSDFVGKEYKYITFTSGGENNKFKLLKNESTYGYNEERKKILTGYQKYWYYTYEPIQDHGESGYGETTRSSRVSNSSVGASWLLAKIESYSGELPANPAVLNRTIWYEYDDSGKLIAVKDANGNRTYYEYDATYTGLISRVSYADGSSTSYGYDNGGRLVSARDGEGVETRYSYDKFSRLSRIYQGESSNPEREICYSYYIGKSSCGAPSCVETKVLSGKEKGTNTYITSRSYYNGAGYLIQEKADAEKTGEYRTVSYEYSVSGLLLRQSNPYITDSIKYSTPSWSGLEYVKYDYDEMDRLYQVTAQDGTVTGRTVYAEPGLTYSIDGKGNVSAVKTSCGVVTSWPYAGEAGKLNETSYASTRSSCLGLNAALTDGNLYHVTAKGCAGLSIIEETGKDGSSSVKTNTIRITLDSAGQKTIYEDPDKGTWTYEYDLNGNLTKQTDARGNITQFSYDSLNRVVSKTTTGGNQKLDSTYVYRKDGQLESVTYPYGKDEYEYNTQKQVVKQKRSIDGYGEREVSYTYTKAGLPDTVTYPDGNVVTYGYTRNGKFSTMNYAGTEFASGTQYNAYGAVSSLNLDNGLINTKVYDKLIRCTELSHVKKVEGGTETGFSLTYEYDVCGNITKKTDSTGLISESYTYDGRNRLKSSTSTRLGSHEWTYDDFNNIISWTRTVGNTPKESSYTYEGLVNGSYEGTTTAGKEGALTAAGSRHGPHAVTSIETGGKTTKYVYNANGDMTGSLTDDGKGRIYGYDCQNRMTGMTVSDGTNTNRWTYAYDDGGERIIKNTLASGEGGRVVASTVYWFTGYEETYENVITSAGDILAPTGQRLASRVSYLSSADGTTIQKTEILPCSEINSAEGVRKAVEAKTEYLYHIKDLLGSTVRVYNENGECIETLGYEPFGKLIMKNGERIDKEPGTGDSGLTGAKRTYTGHMLETDDGLYYCHARWYDAGTGRFIQADSVLDGLNRYTYCGNNPVNFSDPTGTKKSAEQKAAEKAEKQAAKQAKKEAREAEKAAKAAEKQAKKEAREAERAARAAENPEKAGAQIIGAISDFISQYQKMKDENIIGNDHYNHAMANSRATQRGKYGKMTAQFLSFVREASDVLRKGDSDKDVREDNIANRYGREIQPGESPEQYNAQFDTRQGGHRADLTGKASEETPRNVSDFLNSYFTRDEYEK